MSSLGLLGLKRSTQTSGHKSLVCVETSFQPTERGQVNEILQPASDPEVNQSTSRWWFDFWRCFQDFIHPTARRATWYCMPDYRHAWLGRAVGQSISLKLPGSKREEVPNDALTDGKERNRLKLRSSLLVHCADRCYEVTMSTSTHRSWSVNQPRLSLATSVLRQLVDHGLGPSFTSETKTVMAESRTAVACLNRTLHPNLVLACYRQASEV